MSKKLTKPVPTKVNLNHLIGYLDVLIQIDLMNKPTGAK